MSLAAGLEERRLEQRCDGRSPLEPDRKRRHGEDGILSQQLHQPRDVGLFPQGYIAVKQVLQLGARQRELFLAPDVALLQSASGPLQGGIDGPNREVEPLGHFARFPGEHLAQEQNRPLHWR
jgi:hypothetical protein